MNRVLLATLLAFNFALAGLVLWVASTGTLAQGTGVSVSELKYGSTDIDGDGQYTRGDDEVLQWLFNHAPAVLDQAALQAKVNANGGIDLSPHLLSFTNESLSGSE